MAVADDDDDDDDDSYDGSADGSEARAADVSSTSSGYSDDDEAPGAVRKRLRLYVRGDQAAAPQTRFDAMGLPRFLATNIGAVK